MKAKEFIQKFGWNDARVCILNCACPEDRWFMRHGSLVSDQDFDDLKRLVESYELVEKQGGLERVKKAIDGKHIGYTHFYLHSNGRYVFLDHYVDFIPDHAQHIGMFNKAIAEVESCMEVASESN